MRNFLIIICCAAAAFMAGCKDDANSVGNNLIKGNEKFIIADTTLIAVSDTVFNVSVPNGFGASNIIGKTNDVEAKTWLRFTTGIQPDSLRGWNIDTVEFRFTVSYTWNAPATPAVYEIREALTGWTQAGMTRDSLPLAQIGTTVLGRITQPLAVGDTLVVQLTDTTAIRRWLNFAIDSTAAPFYGFVIAAKPGTTTGAFGYSSALGSYAVPSLTIRLSKNGAYDTLSFSSSEDTFIASANVTTKPELEVRGGVSTWSKIKFNVSSIPPNSIINNGSLELTLNSSDTQLGVGTPDSVSAFLAKVGSGPSSIDSTYRILGWRKDTTTANPVYVFNITKYIQFMISPGTPYDGIVLQAIDNIASVDHLAFFTSKDPDPQKRPRLLITTSKK